MLPTIPRLIAGICLGFLAFTASELAKPLWPEGTYFGAMSTWNTVFGFLIGWVMLGTRITGSYASGISNGFTITALGTAIVLLIHGADEMVDLAMRNRYGGFMDAFAGIFENAFEYGQKIATQQILLTLFLGGCLAGLITEWTARRWR